MKCIQVYGTIFKLQNVCTEYAKYIKLFNNANQINLLQCGLYMEMIETIEEFSHNKKYCRYN